MKEKSVSLKNLISNIFICVVLLSLVACSSEQKTELPEKSNTAEKADFSFNTPQTDSSEADELATIDVSIFETWSSTQFKNIKVVYPPNHLFADTMNDYAKIYKTILRRNAQFFRMPEPTDSIVMFYLTGFGQGKEITHSEFPSIRGDSVFYWPGNRFGVLAAKYMLNRWTSSEPSNKILFHGIMRLLDASGRDYHTMTSAFIDSNKFIAFETLLKDDMIDFNWEAYQSAEAASFVDYFVYKYGMDNFKLLYESQTPFDSTIQIICDMNIKSLQQDWLQIVAQVVKNKSNQ